MRTLLKSKSEQDCQMICAIRLQSLVRMYLTKKIMDNDNLSDIVIQKYIVAISIHLISESYSLPQY